MIISRKRSIPDFSIKINGNKLDECNSYKYLGVYIDKNLNWKDQVDHVCKKVSKACGALARIRHSVDINILRNVYHALLYSYIRYGIVVWGNANKSILKPLENLVNRAIRIMSFIPDGNFELAPVFKDLKLLNLSQAHLLETGKFVFKSKNLILPDEIGNYFSIDRCSEEHNHRTRYLSNFWV